MKVKTLPWAKFWPLGIGILRATVVNLGFSKCSKVASWLGNPQMEAFMGTLSNYVRGNGIFVGSYGQ